MSQPVQTRKRHRRPPARDVTPETPIWCPACVEHQPASAFNKETRRFSGLSNICRAAQAAKRQTAGGKAATRERNKRRWQNPEYRRRGLAAAKARRKVKGHADLRRARARLQLIVDEWKRPGCIDCGYPDVRAIDPDHVDGEVKVGHVSRMVTMCVAAERLRAELAKCVPRCSRCHRRITQQQRSSTWRVAERLPPSWRRRLEFQDQNDAVKLARGCEDCGWAEWARGLDWDHVRGDKVAGVATLIANGRSWTEIETEMAKCEVVCANCHRIRTADRRLVSATLGS